MKKNRKRAVSIALSLVLAMTAVNITGCGKKADSTKGELNLFIWTEYVPDEVIKDFEKEYGIKVNVSTFSSNEDMLAKVTERPAMEEKKNQRMKELMISYSRVTIW